MSGYLDRGYAVFKPGRLQEIRCQVRCRKKRHVIIRTRKGRLVFPGHDMARERNLQELGGEECRCMEILRLWRGRPRPEANLDFRRVLDDRLDVRHVRADRLDAWTPYFGVTKFIPESIAEGYQDRWTDQACRTHARQEHVDWLAAVGDPRKRHEERTKTTVRKCLDACSYAVGNRGSVQVTVCQRKDDWHHNVRVDGDADSSVWYVLVPYYWYYRVYLRGDAVIDGHFVFRVISREDTRAVVARQSRDGKLEVCGAVAHGDRRLVFAS